MEAVRRIIDSSLLSGVISLPKGFQNRKVELIVFLTEEKAALPPIARADIHEMLKGSITESLIGILPDSDVSIEKYRAERLEKYERID